MVDPEGQPDSRSEPAAASPDAAPAPGSDAARNEAAAPGSDAARDEAAAASPDAAPPPDAAPGSWPAIGYWVARSRPAGPPPPPPTPAWTKAYELPSARQVVSSGLQLAVASSAAIRRASIYIGLLSLGAFGPATIMILIGIGRLMSDPGTADTLTSDPSLIFIEQPELMGPLLLIYLLVILGILLLVAISVDAQGIAISLLGATASDRPMRLREAITRARQVFWRLLGAGLLVGVVSSIATFIVAIPFLRPFDTNQGVTFIASMIGTLLVTPFAFAAAGIVLGDVGPIEALRRSMTLFRARPRIALVVTLFTLVTSAIQTFAIGAGADVAIRVAEFLHLGLDQGGPSAILTAVVVLAFIVAYGSLTVTIAAIVAAPQVAGFLGLTFYSGGLDRARIPEGAAPRGFRWVTLPMLASMIGLALIAALGLPTITDFQPRAASPVLAFLRSASEPHAELISPFGTPVVVEDPAGDHGAGAASSADILAADMAGLYEIPGWMLDDVFPCGSTGVACGDSEGSGSPALDQGALLFVQRMAAAPPQVPDGPHAEWGPMVRIPGYVGAPEVAGRRFEGANHRFVTELDGGRFTLRQHIYEDGSWVEYFTSARSAWRGDLLVTLVPLENIADEPSAWDAYASVRNLQAPADDNVRPADGEVIELELMPWIDFFSTDFGAPAFGP